MIWIATFCLLAVISWLLFNAWNERRWVYTHQDDKSVVADQGLIPKYSQWDQTDVPEGRYSINKPDSSVGRFATGVKEKTSSLGSTIEQKSAAKFKGIADIASAGGSKTGERSWSEIGDSIVGENSTIGRATENVSKKAIELGEKLPTEKLKPAVRDKSASSAEPSGPVGRFIKNVSNRIEEIDRKV